MSSRTKTKARPRLRGDHLRIADGRVGAISGTAVPVFIRSPSPSDAPVPVTPSHNRGTTMVDQWPLRDFIELGALPGAVSCARLHARQMLWEWGLTTLGEDTELIVSELTTNAVAAARSMTWVSPVRLWLLADSTRVVILLWDANPQPPVREAADLDAESGRGLLLVEALSQKWGWYATPQTGGKVTWALCEK